MENLTTRQIEVMEKAYKQIRQAKQHDTYESYIRANYDNDSDWQIALYLERNNTKYWENLKNNIVLTSTSSHTLRSLEKKGYIKIIVDSAKDLRGTCDTIKIIKF